MPRTGGIASNVSIHAPARGATAAAISVSHADAGFNPRPRARGDRVRSRHATIDRWFQSTPPREGRLARRRSASTMRKFQSTPPREGATAIDV